MRVGELCLRDVATIAPTESVVTAARRMRDEGVAELVVVERIAGAAHPLGLLTERDLVVGALAAEPEDAPSRLPSRLTVRDVLSDGFAAVTVDEDVDETLHRMRSFAVRRLPVIDRTGVLYGVVTLDELLAAIREDIDERVAPAHRRVHRAHGHLSPRDSRARDSRASESHA